MQGPWRITLLGWLRAETEGYSVTRFATHHTAALLARLALWPRRAHSREELAELLWPEAPADATRARLRQALTSLRHQLEPPGVEAGSVLIADRTHIRLNPSALSTDVADFEAAIRAGDLERAAALYAGELLPGFYEEWVIDERERLAALYEQIEEARPGAIDTVSQTREPEPRLGAETPAGTAPPPPLIVRLPLQFTRFFGRTEELLQIAALLGEHRLVTLTGPGGAGKTRLSIEAARQQAGAGCGDVVFVGLSDMVVGAGVDRLAGAVAEALRLERGDAVAEAARPITDRLVEALSRRPTLLVLDNAEHVAPQAGRLALSLLSRVGTLRVLVASRRRLHIAGERELTVPSLGVPDGDATKPEAMIAAAAVQLFIDRAQTVRPDFQLTPRNAADVASLCRQLEGAPLAIELAAARAATLTPSQMINHLSKRFEFLATRRTDKDARHRSLWAAISWSVDLLPTALATFWNRLAVFRGGFTDEAAAALTGERAAIEFLTQLRERSLITIEDCDTELRFRMLESIREFAELEWDAEEQRVIEDAHASYFFNLARASGEPLRGPEQASWLARLDRDHDNFRAALEHGIATRNTDLAQRLAGALWGFWERRGNLIEARQWLEAALALPGPEDTDARALALNRLGAVMNYVGSLNEATLVNKQALEVYENLGDQRGIALMWNRLGFVAVTRGDADEACRAFTEALTRERALGNRSNMAAALVNLGILAQRRKEYDAAREFHAEAIEHFRALNNPAGVADAHLNLASVWMAEENWDQASPLLEQAAATFGSLGDRWSGAYVTLNLAIVARRQGHPVEAATLADAALAVCREVGDRAKTADALSLLGTIARQGGDKSEADLRFREALEIYRETGQHAAEAACQRELEMPFDVPAT